MTKRLSTVLMIVTLLSGCAQVMAFQQPGPRKCRPDVLREGVERSMVIGCLGSPLASDEHTQDDNDKEVLSDTYVYEDGGAKNAGWSKAGRVVLYTAGDIFTLFLTQLIWMPAEAMLLDATKHQAAVDYERGSDSKWHVTQVAEGETR